MKPKHRVAFRFVSVTGLFCVAGLSIASAPQRSQRLLVPPDARPIQGKTYAEWSVAWNQWSLSLPCVPGHPNLDDPAFDVTLGQSGNVWFLAAPFGASVQRAISIPAGIYLFMGVLTVDASSLEDPPFWGCTADEQRAQVRMFVDCMAPFFEIDGVAISNIRRYRTQSPQFDIILVNPNCLGVRAGKVTECPVSPPPPPMVGTAVSDGYFVMIRPMSRGQHTIHFGGIVCGFTIDMTYHVTVF